MIRDVLVDTYEVDDEGMILSFGKYEGEKIYVPYFWNLVEERGIPHGEGYRFETNRDERSVFPELGNRMYVFLIKGADGKVTEEDGDIGEEL